jgi:TonB-linked SusC/RagA family outer membrane protein
MKKTSFLKGGREKRHSSMTIFLLLFLFLLTNSSFVHASQPFPDAGQKPVNGIVTEKNGTPLPGVTVLQKDQPTNGTVTDVNGKFTINVPEGSTLSFSFIGFNTKEVVVNGESINMVLEESVVNIDEVVAIGYGKLKSSQVSSSIAKVSSEDISERAVTRVDQAIQGKIAGVQVQEVSGSPGRSLSVQVRGTSSINYSGNPLYVVDGFPISGDLNSINPGDIESIEVLKDAASAAIYGSRGSNGVILITTKSGKSGKSTIEFDAYYGLQKRFSKVDVLNRDEYIDYAIEERTNSYIYSGGDPSVPETQRHNYKFAIDPLWRTNPQSFPDNDWQDLIDRIAPIQSYTISASGGNDKTKYYISSNYIDQKGIIINSDYKRYSVRANVENKIKDWIAVGVNLSLANSKRNDPDTDTNAGPISRSILVAPVVGLDEQTIDGGYYYYHANFYLNPIHLAKEILNETKSNHLMSNFYAELTPIKNLVFRTSFGSDINSDKNQYYKTNNINRGSGSFGSVSNALTQSYLSENTLNYNLATDDWTLNLLGGYTYQEETYEYSYLKKTGFPDDDIKTLNAGTVLDSGTSTAEKWSLISYLARANMSYIDKYIFSASIRRDGCSRFGKDNRWGIFPSASAGWIISEESFMEDFKDVVSNLKLRASIGTVGNNNIGNYSSIGLMTATKYIVDDSSEGGYSPSSFSNMNLGWEKTSTTDLGVDLGFYNNRVNLTFDYYISNTKDLLLQVPIPQVTGFSNALQNIGKVQNRGYEIELLTKNLVGRFKWTTAFNISHNKNEVKELGPDGSAITGYLSGFPITITRIGDAIGSYYLLETDGLFKDQADVDANKAMAYLSPNPQPGDLKYKDQDGSKDITAEDKTIVGHNAPDFFWGLTNTFSYKGFDLSVFIDGQWGNKLLNLGKKETTQSRGNVRGYWRDRWRSTENPGNGKVPRAVTTENLTTPSDWWLEDAAFWRIRSINFGYNLPEKVVSKIMNISSLKIYGGVDNVFMHDHFNHMSQTAAYRNSSLTPGIDYDSGYPLAQTFKLGINVKF